LVPIFIAVPRYPALDVTLGHALDGQRALGHVLGDGGARRHERIRGDRHRRDQIGVAADEGPLAHARSVLVHPVVVHHDRAAPEARAGAHVRVSDVRQVVGLHAVAQRAVLHLDEISDPDASADHAAGTQVRRGSDHHVVTDPAVFDGAVGLEVNAAPDAGRALDRAAGLDARIPAHVHVGFDPGALRVDDGDAGVHQLVQLAAMQRTLGLGQQRPRVDAECLLGVLQAHGLHPAPVAHGLFDDVGQVDLALFVAIVDTGQALPQELGVQQIDPRVALRDLELIGSGVGRLDDALHAAVGTAHHDSAHVHLAGEQNQIGPALGLERHHLTQRLAPQERRVAVENQDVAAEAQQGGLGAAHGVARAPGRILHGELGPAREGFAHRVGVVSHDDHPARRLENLRGGERIGEHGPPAQGMEHLRALRLHAGAVTGRQQHHRDLLGRGPHSAGLLSKSVLRFPAPGI
jgi:hypothetical protein